jgi:hypothetical protein
MLLLSGGDQISRPEKTGNFAIMYVLFFGFCITRICEDKIIGTEP